MAKKKTTKKLDPKEIVVIGKSQQCTARVKKCQNCGYKYRAGDRTWNCPECGFYRRCRATAKYPYTVCRMHGAGGGRPPESGKFIPPQQIADAYNRIYEDSSLLSLAYNVALSEARTAELLNMINDMDVRAQAGDVAVGINNLLSAVYQTSHIIEYFKEMYDKQRKKKDGKINPVIDEMNFNDVEWFVKCADGIKELLAPAVQEQKVWRQVNEQLEITRRLNDTERKWIDQHDQMVPMSTVLESISTVIRMALILIPDTQDRARFAESIRALSPRLEGR